MAFSGKKENCPYCRKDEDPSQSSTLHLHLFPRYIDDPYAGLPIDTSRIEPPLYKGDEFELFVKRMQETLKFVEV